MTNEHQQKILEAAAKAGGPEYQYDELEHCWYKETDDDYFGNPEWNPLTNPADTAEMCAKIDINSFFYLSIPMVECSAEDAGDKQTIRHTADHNGTREEKVKAWMYAATMVAAKIGGYKE